MSAKLDQYREKYPLYKSVADDVLARALHKKYYSDVPFDTFSEKIGLPGLPDLTPAPALDQLRPDQELDPIDRGPTGTPMQNARRGLSRTGKQLLPGAGRAKENQALEAADAAGFTPKSTVEAKTPEELRQERISRLETDRARLEQGAREAAPRSAGEVATDYGLAINQGFKKIPGALAKVVNKDRGTGLTPQNEFALAIGANIGAKLGSTRAQELADRLAANTKPHSEFLQSFADQADEQAADAGERMSPRAKALGREFSEAEGIGGKAAFLAANPGFLADLTVQSAPFIATGGVAGKAVGAVAGLEAGIGANLATQGVMSAASSSEEAKAYVLGVPQEELEQLPEYKRLSGQYRPEQIRKILAEKASDTAFAAGLVINAAVLGATAKLSVVERAMHGAGEVGQTGSRVANTGIGALKEFGQEAPQGAGEQVATNVGQMTADNRVGLTDKFGEAFFVEGIVGAGPGGLAGFSQAPNYEDSEVGRAKQAYDAARTPAEKGKANTELIIAQAKAKMGIPPVEAPIVAPVQPEVAPVAEPVSAQVDEAPVVDRPQVQDVEPGAAPSTVAEQDQSEDDELSSLLDQAFQDEQPDTSEPAEVEPAEAEIEPKTESAGVGAIHRIPVDQLTLSPDLPQFKDGANEHGEVEPLGGTFDERGVGPIQVWRRLNGALEVISGRHRLGLQRRSGGKDISAQVYNEADGFTLADAATLDAELNIRDGQGKVKDYVGYFGGKQITEEEADARGLLARATGRRAFTIANKGSQDLIAAHGVDKLSDDAATQIADTAPNDDRMQALGMKSIQDGKSIGIAVNTMRAVKALLGDSPPGSGDMFGFDDSAMREAVKMAEFAHKKQRELSDRLNAITGAAKRPEMAKREGVDIRDKQALQKRIGELKAERSAWDHWHTDQGLIAQIRDGIANGVKFSRTSAGVVEEAPSAEGIEVGEVSDSDAAKYFMPKEEVDSITEGLSVLAKNPKLFRRRLFDGKNMKDIARDGGLNRTGVSREEVIDEDTHEPRMETTHSFAVDQSGKAGVAKIIETDGRVWVDVSGMNRGRGNAEGVYSAAASLAFNTGRDFVEDPNGLSDDAMYRRTVHELSAILKRGDAKNVPAGPFLTSGRKGGPATTPIGKNEARDYNVAVRDRALAIHANTLLAIPEAANVHFDADSNRFTDPDGNVLSDGDLDRLAEHRQANPVGSAMVRGPRKSGGKRAAPVGSTSIKVFAIVEALKRAPTGPARTRLVERLRGIAASSDGLAQLTGILPSKVVGQSGGLTVDAVRNVVQKAFGKRAKKLIADGKLKIVKSETDVPDSIRQSAEPLSSADGTVQGFFDPASGNTYLLADNLADEASARAVMLHEEGVHAGLAEMIGPARINALADILDRLEKTGTKADQETIAAAKKRVSDAGTEAKHRAEETVAYTVEIEEKNADPSPMFRKVITRAHTAIRQWALRRGMGDLTVADIRQLAIGGLEYRARGQRVGGSAKVPGSRATFFSKRAEYVGTHAAPMVDSGAPAHQLNGEFGYPDDIYSPQGPRYYGTGLADLDKRAFAVVNRIRGNPDADVTVYRAVPNTVDGDTINPGDWVSIVHAYAKDHGEGPLGGEYRIISRVVKAKDIFTNGDSIQEWGYDPQDDVADVPARGPVFSKKVGTTATKDLFGNAPSETAQGLADRAAKIDAKLNGGGRVVKPSEGPGDLFGGPRELTKDMFGNQETLFSKNADAARTAKAEAKRRRDEADAIITAVRVAESDIRDVAIRNERLATLEDRARRMLDQWDTNQEIREQIADANRDLARLRKRALAGDRTALKQVTEAENQVKSLRDDLAKAVAAKQKAITAIDQMNTLGGKIDAMDMAKYRSALVDAADAASAIAAKARSVADWWRSRELSLRDATERADTKRRAIARDYGITGPSMLWEYDPTRFDGASGWLHSLREKYQAKFLTFLDAQKDIEAATGQLVADSQNVWRAENLMHGRVENQLKGLEASYTKKIKEHLRKTGALALVEDFMEARAAPARNIDVAKKRPDMPDGGSGMTTAEAKAFLSGKAKGLRSGQELTDGLREQIMPVVRLLDAMRNETLLRLKTTGQITDAVYETLKANTSYAPLRGKNGEPVEGSGLGGTGFDVRGNPIKRALGRGTGNRATNIVAELIGDAEKSIVNGERLRVGKTLARLVLANPNKSLWEVEKVELEAKYSEAADVVYYGLKNLDQESIRFVEKGVPYKITLKDPRMRAAIKNLSPSQLNGMVKFMGALNRYFSAVFTRYNPFFVPINMARDLGMGLISVYAEHGASVAADVAIHYGSAMRAVWRAERGKSVANKYHTYFNEMSEAGGTTAFSQLRNVEDIASHIESDVKTIFQLTREGKPHKAIARVIRESSIVKLVGDVNEAVENAVRLSAYAALRDRGASISKAAEYAKEITVNFNRRGSETSFVNSIILFFNASVQGSTRVLQLMKNPKAVASVTAMGALQFAFAALAMSDEDDDGQTAWDKISEYEKARNFIIAIPSVRDGQMYVKTIKIPVPYGFNLFTYAGGKLAQAMMTKDKFDSAKFTNDMTVAAVDSISPLKFTEGWDSIKPQVVRVFDQRNQNRDNFGRRITNEVPYSDFERPRAYLGRASTPSYFVAAAKGLNWLGGGDEVTPPKVLKGLLDHSPEDLQFLAESFGGGLLKAVDQFGQLGGMVASGVEVRPHEVPILNRLYSEVTPERATADRFRTAEAEIAREKDRVKKTFYQRGEKAAEKVIADTPELKGAWLHRFKTTNDVRDKAGRIRLNAGPGTLVDIKKVADKEIRRIGDEQEAVYNDPKLSMSQRINAIRRLQAEREKVQRRVTIKFKETKR